MTKEKVVIIKGRRGISEHRESEINKYLDEGWSIKSVNMSSETEDTTVIFVIQKEEK